MTANATMLALAADNVAHARRKIAAVRRRVVDRTLFAEDPAEELVLAYLEFEAAQKTFDRLERERQRQMERAN